MAKYFWKDTKGLNADIERHRVERAKLEAKILEIEKEDQSDRMVQARLRTYKSFLGQLEASYVNVISKLGK